MKLVSFSYRGQDRIGVINGESKIVDLGLALPLVENFPCNMIDFINLGDEGLVLAAKALGSGGSSAIIPADEVIWQPPVPHPGKICGVAPPLVWWDMVSH